MGYGDISGLYMIFEADGLSDGVLTPAQLVPGAVRGVGVTDTNIKTRSFPKSLVELLFVINDI
jgi:hypothetical protein